MSLRYHWLLKNDLNDSCFNINKNLNINGSIKQDDDGILVKCYNLGDSGYLSLVDNDLINIFNSGTFSISFWVKVNKLDDNKYTSFISCGNSHKENKILHIIGRKGTNILSFDFLLIHLIRHTV